MPAKDIGWLTKKFQSKEMVYIPDTGTLPEQALNEKKLFTSHSVNSFAGYPIIIKEKTEGFLGLDFITGKNQHDYEELEMFKVISDIIGFSIERKQSDNTLRKAEEKYQRIHENTGAATVTLRYDNTILMSNPEFERLIGIPRHEVEGKRTDVKEKINFSDKTVLIAEDTESNYLYLKEILSSTGTHLLRARNGQEAIEIFRQNKNSIDLIFMDILMPECDGFEASHLIRDIKDDIIIIAQTDFTFEGEIENGLYAGCFADYILKPFNVKAIHRLLEKYLVRK